MLNQLLKSTVEISNLQGFTFSLKIRWINVKLVLNILSNQINKVANKFIIVFNKNYILQKLKDNNLLLFYQNTFW